MRQERQRLLKEAAYLKDYLPKGVLHDLEELRLINDAAAEQPSQSFVASGSSFGAGMQPIHTTGPVHGMQNSGPGGVYTDKLHYANYVPGETPLLQDTYPSPTQHYSNV